MQQNQDGTTEYPAHPAAELFPLLTGVRLKELAEDIKANTLREPILIHDGQILDGRNRLAACKMAGVPPRYDDAVLRDGETPTAYVVSMNLHRRHLSDKQRSAIAAQLVPIIHEEAKVRRKAGNAAGGTAGKGRPKVKSPLDSGGTSQQPENKAPKRNWRRQDRQNESTSIAAKMVGVSRNSVEHAVAVKHRDPREFERILSGETSPGVAYGKVKAKGKPPLLGKRNQDFAKRKVVEILSHVRGLCRALSMVNVPAALAALTKEERKSWARNAKESMSALRGFTSQLEGGSHNDGDGSNDENHRSGSAEPAGASDGAAGASAG